jgi:hypothetical protein
MKVKFRVIVSFIFCTLSAVALAENKTGMKPITTKELRHMQKNLGLKRIKEIKPTALGLKRINERRKALGWDVLPDSAARKFGKDTVLDTTADYDFETSAGSPDNITEIMTGALPTSVDNSTLPSFPQIRWQTWNNCTAWAMGYYQATHNNGLVLGWSNNNSDNTTKCSPKFIYNMINNGVDQGSYFSDGLAMIQKHGCVAWSQQPEDMDYRGWNLNPDQWQDALKYRSEPAQYIYNIDTTTGLEQVKQLLTNGYVVTFGTFINSWQYTTIKSNPQRSSNPLAGKQVMHWVNGMEGSHAMTVVGYDDHAWVDINGNNVVEVAELGVLKIANSWGTNWGHSGYIYVAYDALKTYSAAGGPSNGRQPGFQNRMVYHQPIKSNTQGRYQPKVIARFTLQHAQRNQMSLKFGWSETSATTPASVYTPFAMMNKGGAYAFNGTTTPLSASFVMDLTDLPTSFTGDNKYYLSVSDNTSGSAATLSRFEVIQLAQNKISAANFISSLAADASTVTASVVTSSAVLNLAPTAVIISNVSSGAAPLAVNFDASTSTDSDGSITLYQWSFSDGSSAHGPYVTKTFTSSGSHTATLKVTDDDGASATTTKMISVQTQTDTIAPAVSLDAPLNGSRFARYQTVVARARASDNVGVNKVRFYVNGYLKCTDYTVYNGYYTCSFSMPRGTSIPVRARAYDKAGNYRTSNTAYISN